MSKYVEGYQDALCEVLAKWEDEGADAALAYVRTNMASVHTPRGRTTAARARRYAMTEAEMDAVNDD